MRKDYTCGCGLYVHPEVRELAWHIPDCEYYSKEENEKVERNNRALSHL